MNNTQSGPQPVEIQLHQRSRVLELTFDDGAHFHLPCEYLRVFSPSAEVKLAQQQGDWPRGKQNVNITEITPVGGYAVQLHFDDGHDSGIYSWKTLYRLGRDQEPNWRQYQAALGVAAGARTVGPIVVTLLYFVGLAKTFGRESERVELPAGVDSVQALIEWLRARGPLWDRALSGMPLKITVNKQFVEANTTLRSGDEIALVPTAAPGAEA